MIRMKERYEKDRGAVKKDDVICLPEARAFVL